MDGITDSTDMGLSKLWEIVKDRGAWCTAVHEVTSLTQLSNWKTTTTHIQLPTGSLLSALIQSRDGRSQEKKQGC